MRHGFEALQRNQRPPCYFGSLDPTLTAATHSSRSTSEIDLHSRLTRGVAQRASPAYTVAMDARRRAKNTFFTRLVIILRDRSDVRRIGGGGRGN